VRGEVGRRVFVRVVCAWVEAYECMGRYMGRGGMDGILCVTCCYYTKLTMRVLYFDG